MLSEKGKKVEQMPPKWL